VAETGAETGNGINQVLFNLVPPATLAVIVLFWSLAPAPLADNPGTILVAVCITMAVIQGLEWVKERHVGWRWNKREFLTDVFYVALGFTAIDALSSHLAEDPLKAVKHALHISTPWAMHLPFLVQVALVIVLVEFGQYWMHRLMHNNTLFWLTHAPHHHITQLNALKGAVGNPIELFLISLSVVALFDLPLSAVFCAANVGTAISSFAHANVRSDPPRWYAFFFTTIRHHSLHHSVPYEDTRCNYANSLILIDRIFGTFREGEADVVGQDQRKRLSIREQFAFPFVPLIAMIKAKPGRSAPV
jgi:sterol desaturase/sphingolipid hydroxylase (fatty acid hydroxylase superfamily)